jgi:hypothetical protein
MTIQYVRQMTAAIYRVACGTLATPMHTHSNGVYLGHFSLFCVPVVMMSACRSSGK